MSPAYDQNAITEFVAENRDHLEAIEPDLLAMEQSGAETAPDTVNRVFRAVHSVKGSSGFFRFNAIKELSHVMENVLMQYREGNRDPDSHGIDALLAGVDKLRIMFVDVEKSDEIPYQEELDRLHAVLSASPASSSAPGRSRTDPGPSSAETIVQTPKGAKPSFETGASMSNPGAAFGEPSRQAALDAIGSGSYVYTLCHVPEPGRPDTAALEDLMAAYGQCLGRTEMDPKTGRTLFLFATVMESDLLPEALELSPDRILALELEDLRTDPDFPSSRAEKTVTRARSEEKGLSHETIHVPVVVIDKLMNLAGELVLGRNQLRQELGEASLRSPKLANLIQGVDVVTSEVQEKIMQMRMQPVGNLFNRFPRLVRDLSRELNKEADLIVEGRDVELDKSIIEGLSDPLNHLLRNSLDHGIEDPETRKKEGKPGKGTLHLAAFHEGGQVNITLGDDGRGIDPEVLAKKAVKTGIVTEDDAARMSRKEKIGLVFTPGFSTARAVSEVSGRGVGMDVVKTNIERLGGHIDLDSETGKGAVARIRLPLTLAIIPSLIVGAEGHRFAIPQPNVKELVCIRAGEVAERIEEVAGAEVLRLRENLLPVVRLADVLGLERSFIHPATGEMMPDRRDRLLDRRARGAGALPDAAPVEAENRMASADRRKSWHSDLYVVVLKLGENRFGLCVDRLYDTEEIVVKPLSEHVKNARCFAGATIMGDGRVAMILDAAGIAEHQVLRFSEIGAEASRRREEEKRRREEQTGLHRPVLLFNGAPDESFAIPLENVSRLEMVAPEAIHRIGEHEFMDYRGRGLPLLRLDRFLPVSPIPPDLEELYAVIPKSADPCAGILASRILDTLETEMPAREQASRRQGLSGSLFLGERLTTFLDVEELLSLFERESNGQNEHLREGGTR